MKLCAAVVGVIHTKDGNVMRVAYMCITFERYLCSLTNTQKP